MQSESVERGYYERSAEFERVYGPVYRQQESVGKKERAPG